MITPPNLSGMLAEIGITGKHCAIVGIRSGETAVTVIQHQPKAIMIVDPWIEPEICKGLENVTVVKSPTYPYAQQVEYASMDLVYLDGNHTFDGCLCDALLWYQKVRPGGWIGGSNYGSLSVQYAVRSFLGLAGGELGLLTTEGSASWGVQKLT